MIIITQQRHKCIGCNYCVELAPDRWIMSDKDGKSVLVEGKGKGGYDGYDDDFGAAAPPRDPAGGQQKDRSGAEYRVPCCEEGCGFRAKIPQALVTHHAARHGEAP